MKQYFLKAFFILAAAIVMEILPLSSTWGQELPPAYQDAAFWQETHEAYPLPMGMENSEVRSLIVDTESTVWIAAAAGVFALVVVGVCRGLFRSEYDHLVVFHPRVVLLVLHHRTAG